MIECECGYTCKRNYHLFRHQKSKAHETAMTNNVFLSKNEHGTYECTACSYVTHLKSNYARHMASTKHQTHTVTSGERKPAFLVEVMELFFEHMKRDPDQMSSEYEMFKTMADRIMNPDLPVSAPPTQSVAAAATTTTTTTTTTTHNSINNPTVNINNTNKFSLNVYLNEECKNAINMSDFIKGVNVTMEDLEHLGHVGYVEGMTKILSKAINQTEKSERPMHCTDVKRETIYVRKNDEWHKDVELEETKRFIQHVAHKNHKTMAEWRQTQPEVLVHDTEPYESWYRISRNICNTDPNAIKKLIRHLASMTAVEKDDAMAPLTQLS